MAKKEKQAKEKPLEKMTAKDLREMAKGIPDVSGVHGMNKTELISAIKAARGIVETQKVKSDASVRDIKKKIRALRSERQNSIKAHQPLRAAICRRRISRLKKKTRRFS